MKKIIFLFTLSLLFTGCEKQRVSRPSPATPKTFFGTNIADTNVETAADLSSVKAVQKTDGELAVSSNDWLEFSSHLIETGTRLSGADGDRLLKEGHQLAHGFYELPYSHTIMTATSQPMGDPYLDVASPQAKPVLIQKFIEAIDNVKTKVTEVAGQTTVVLNDLPKDPLPEVVLQRVIDGLNSFKSLLDKSKDGNGDAIIDQISDSINSDYIKGLENLRDASHIDKNFPLSVSLQKIGKSLKSLSEVSDSERQRLLVSVNWGVSLAQKTEALNDAQGALIHLVDFWLNKYFRNIFPQNLKDLFKDLTDKQILALATNNQGPLYNDADWARIKVRTDYILMPDLEDLAQYVQNNGVLLNTVEWNKLKLNQLRKFENLLQTKEVKDLVDLLSVNENVTDLREKKGVIINNWLGLSNRLSFPQDLKTAFAMFNDQDLELLKSNPNTFNDTFWLVVSGHAKLAFAHYKIISGLNSYGSKPGQTVTAAQGISNFKDYFQDKIIAATRTRMDNAIIPIASTLPHLLSSTLIPILEKQKDSGPKIADESFNVYSRYYMGKLVFGAQGLTKEPIDSDHLAEDNAVLAKYPLPILEKSALKFDSKNGTFTNLPNVEETSAETLGVALTNNYFRLETLDQAENIKPASSGAIGLNFQSIAKMLAIAGYTNADSQLTESLSVAMTPGHEGQLLDIHNYAPNKIVFATPDEIFIKDQYKMDQKSAKNPQISVTGQMHLLRGYSQMMRFFKPWEPSAFDDGLGALRIDEAPSLKAFDKEDFFLLSIGLASIVLENLPLKMVGLITDKGAFVESSSVADTSQVPATGAVLGNYDMNKMSHVVLTRDIAISIEAIAEFYDVIKDLEKTQDAVLINGLKATPPTAIRNQLAKLLSGLVLFSTGKLMAQDGGFAGAYDGDSGKVSTDERKLEDQLLMERAFLKAAKILDSNFILARAADNFFFLNGHFWDPKLGFYRQNETSRKVEAVKLDEVTLALDIDMRLSENLSKVMTQSSITPSLNQLLKLKSLWVSRFLNSTILNDSPVNLTSDYSL